MVSMAQIYRCVNTSTVDQPDGVPETWLPPLAAALNVEVDGAGSSVRLVARLSSSSVTGSAPPARATRTHAENVS